MNWKRLLLAALVVFVFVQLSDLVIHGKILEGVYRELTDQGVFRSESEMAGYMWVMILMLILTSFLFTYIFVKGYEGKGIMEGVRYGIVMGFLLVYISSYNQFVIYPITYALVWYWIISGFIQVIIAGIIVAAIYKPKAAKVAPE